MEALPTQRTWEAAPPLPRELQVEVTGACNLRCRMCLVRYQPALNKAEGSLSFERFARLLDGLPGLERVTLQGLGEPLLAPDLLRLVHYAAERGIGMGFNTNATLLKPQVAAELVRSGLSWLHISLDGATAATYEGIRDGARFELVRRNVRELVRIRRALDSETPELSIVFVAMRRNLHELPDVVRTAAELGIRDVWVQNLSHSFADTGREGTYREIALFTEREALWQGPDAAAEAIFADARAVARALGVNLRLPRLEEPAEPRQPGRPGCTWPWESAYVRHDGKVQPCCMLMGSDRGIMGDIGNGDLAAVWEGDAYQDFRRALMTDEPPEPCRGCSLYRHVF